MHKSATSNRSVVVCLFVAWTIFSAGPRPVVHSHTEFATQALADSDDAIARHLAMFHTAPEDEPSGLHFHWVFNPTTACVGQDGTLAVPLIQASTNELTGGPTVEVGRSAAPFPWERWSLTVCRTFGEMPKCEDASPKRVHSFLSSSVSIQEIFCVYRC